jgi:hypothetical protein
LTSFFLLLSVVPLYASRLGSGDSGAGFSTGALMLTTLRRARQHATADPLRLSPDLRLVPAVAGIASAPCSHRATRPRWPDPDLRATWTGTGPHRRYQRLTRGGVTPNGPPRRRARHLRHDLRIAVGTRTSIRPLPERSIRLSDGLYHCRANSTERPRADTQGADTLGVISDDLDSQGQPGPIGATVTGLGRDDHGGRYHRDLSPPRAIASQRTADDQRAPHQCPGRDRHPALGRSVR